MKSISFGKGFGFSGLLESFQIVDVTLIDNAVTNETIGNKLQDKSIRFEYTLTRGTGIRTGSFDVLNDGSALFMSPDTFITNGVAEVEDTEIVFSVAYAVNDIQITATLDNSGDDAIMKYVTKKM
jgi:hypothetical protein